MKEETKFLSVTLTELRSLIKHELKFYGNEPVEDPVLISLEPGRFQPSKQLSVSEMVGLSGDIILRKVKRGEFPKPVQLHKKRIAWKRRDVIEWIRRLPYISTNK